MPLRDMCEYIPQQPNFLAKRTQFTVFSDELSEKEIKEQLELIKKHDIKLICTIRNREDTLKSDNGWVVPFRYDACIDQQKRFCEYIDMFVGFHTLITDPNLIQSLIADYFGLESKHKFSEYPNFVPDFAFNITSHNERYRARRIGESV